MTGSVSTVACVACDHTEVIPTPDTHPLACGKCGAPVRVTTAAPPAPEPSTLHVEVNTEAGQSVLALLKDVEERVTAWARSELSALASRVNMLEPAVRSELAAFDARLTHHSARLSAIEPKPTVDPAASAPAEPPSNVGEVIHSLEGPTIDTGAPEGELPPGSA